MAYACVAAASADIIQTDRIRFTYDERGVLGIASRYEILINGGVVSSGLTT